MRNMEGWVKHIHKHRYLIKGIGGTFEIEFIDTMFL